MTRVADPAHIVASKWSRPVREARARLTDEERRFRDLEARVDAVEAHARQLTGRPHFGCIPAWAWRGALARELRRTR